MGNITPSGIEVMKENSLSMLQEDFSRREEEELSDQDQSEQADDVLMQTRKLTLDQDIPVKYKKEGWLQKKSSNFLVGW